MSSNTILSQANTLRLTHRAKYEDKFDICIDRFTFLDEESEDDSELHIVVDKAIYASHHSTVYLGKAGNVTLVVKTCHEPKFSKDLCREAKAYKTKLSGLQGGIIPKLYGYFKGTDYQKCRISCIVLKDCGDTLETPFHKLETAEKYVSRFLLTSWGFDNGGKTKTMTVLGKLHQHGYHPGDFREQNVVAHNGAYKLIDFHVLYYHECCWRDGMDWRTYELNHRAARGFPCDVLFRIGSDMHLWGYTDSPMIKICGEEFYGTEYPPQDIVDKLLSNRYYNYHTNAKVVLHWLTKVKKEMDENNGNLDIEAQISKRPILPVDPKHGRYYFRFRLEIAC